MGDIQQSASISVHRGTTTLRNRTGLQAIEPPSATWVASASADDEETQTFREFSQGPQITHVGPPTRPRTCIVVSRDAWGIVNSFPKDRIHASKSNFLDRLELGRRGRSPAPMGDRLCSPGRPRIPTHEHLGSNIRALAKRRSVSWQRAVSGRDQVSGPALRIAQGRTGVPIREGTFPTYSPKNG
jgi:hypothetical protein